MQKELKQQIFKIKLDYFKENGVLPSNVKHGKMVAALKYKCACEACLIFREDFNSKNKESAKVVRESYKEYFKTHGTLPDGVNHGTTGYAAGCRCETCVSAIHSSIKKYSDQQRELFKQGKLNIKHGLGGYKIGCRCDVCKSTNKIQQLKQLKQLEQQRKYLKETGTFLNPRTKHGTHVALKYGCRCEICVTFQTDYSNKFRGDNPEYVENQKKYQKKRRETVKMSGKPYLPNAEHGTMTAYNSGCRCSICKIAKTASYTELKSHGKLI